MKNINNGLKELVNELSEEIIHGIRDSSDVMQFEPKHKDTLSFLIFRFGPDIVLESMGGISLNSADYFLNRLRSRCATRYQSYFEEKV